jgi:hypothetical protein
MDNNRTNTKQTAASANPAEAVRALDRLLAQAYTTHQPGEITVVEKWVKVQQSYCRVAVVISNYGTLIEIGSRRGSDSQITWTFREEELSKAKALLAEYSSS